MEKATKRALSPKWTPRLFCACFCLWFVRAPVMCESEWAGRSAALEWKFENSTWVYRKMGSNLEILQESIEIWVLIRKFYMALISLPFEWKSLNRSLDWKSPALSSGISQREWFRPPSNEWRKQLEIRKKISAKAVVSRINNGNNGIRKNKWRIL